MPQAGEAGETTVATGLAPRGEFVDRIAGELATLKDLDTDSLKRELAQSVHDVAAKILRLAAIVRLLEDRGEDLSEVRVGMFRYIRRIAYGQVLPEIVTNFVDFPLLMNRLTTLPLPDQQRVVRGEGLPIVLPADGGYDVRLINPLNMTAEQVQQAIGDGRIRSQAEQIAYLDARRAKPAKLVAVKRKTRVDRERNGLVVGRSFVSLTDVLSALAELRQPTELDPVERSTEGDEAKTLAIKLTHDEHRRLKLFAAKSDVSMSDLAYRALRAAGLI